MSGGPPDQEEPDVVGEEYRRASALDAGRPSEAVRRAVFDHAARLAAERAATSAIPRRDIKPAAASPRRWRPAVFGSLAAAAVAGLLVAPHFWRPQAPPTTTLAPTADRAPAADEAPPAAQAPSTLVNRPRPSKSDNAIDSGASAARGARVAAPAAPAADAAERGADPAAALRRAAETGDARALQVLLDARRDMDPGEIDARDTGGRTALMLATLFGHANVVTVLLAHGADPNAADADGRTPLQAATAGGRQEIIRSLRGAGAR